MNVIDLTKELVSIPSTLGKTDDIEQFVLSRIEKVKNARAELVPVGSLGNNVLGSVFHGEGLPTIFINGHLDTVEVCKGWTREPFEPHQDEDRLYGLGSADMKSGVALAMDTFEKLASLGCVNAIFAGSIDEEGDSAGAFALLSKGLKADLCLIPEPSGGSVMMGCRGRVVFEIETRGTSAHGSRPETGVNAISLAGRLLGEIDKLELIEDELLGRGSFCPLEIKGGTTTLSVPDRCWLKLDRHYVRGEGKDRMMNDLRSAAGILGDEKRFDMSFWKARPTPFLEPYTTANEGLVQVFNSAAAAQFSYGKSVGDYNAFAKAMPTVVYGPHGENWHAADEWVSISSILECQKGYGRFIECLKK
jgi:acetylornithine deacetylase/succinyl-diaminopimelate desuccinylase-like protein